MNIRRFVGMMLIMTVVASALVGLAGPASAGQTFDTFRRSTWAHTDSVSPFKSFVDGTDDAPVGAWRDAIGKHHISKSYFTFDLAALRGARIFHAQAFVAEKSANDCTKPRSTELWLTDTAQRPTWQYQPRERAKLPGPGAESSCVWDRVAWDATDTVRQAVSGNQTLFTLALRMSRDVQGDVAYGRQYANDLRIMVVHNFPPNVPTNLTVDGLRKCSDGSFYWWNNQPMVSASISDPDGGYGLSGRFAFWPVDHPEQRVERHVTSAGSSVDGFFPAGMIADGNAYAWAVRTEDGDDVSAWTEPCLFTADLTRPAVAPTVTSPEYPNDGAWHGGPGVPGTFTFGANGIPDVVGYRWAAGNQTGFAPAEGLGGPATITYPPQSSGPNGVTVDSVDRAGHHSPSTTYRFYVLATEPVVTATDPQPGYGVPTELLVEPRMPDVVSYTFSMNGGPHSTVAADPSGTTVISVIPPELGFDRNVLDIWSTTSTGERSGINHFQIHTIDEPRVRSDVYPESRTGGGVGVPGEFIFRPRQPGVVEYRYVINEDWEHEVIVPAAPDGTARFLYTPTQPGFHVMNVASRSAEHGWSLLRADYYFDVNP